jgi:two-component system, chemotaxis family, chemotaxis protein CheY
MKIVAVDDTRTLRELLSQALREAGHDVVEAENGQEGFERALEHRPDAIVTDLNMPVLDGIGLTKAVRANDAVKHTPILILTTENGVAIKTEGRKAGATAWMVKPFDREALLSFLDRHKS